MPVRVRRILRSWYDRVLLLRVLRLCVKYPRIASLYYVADRSFQEEHSAVMRGKLRHITSQAGREQEGRYTLRRNTHRVEKGLIMVPRRPVFATQFIEETARLYAESIHDTSENRACSTQGAATRWGIDDPDIALNSWVGDVLHRYFEAVEPGLDERVDRARSIYQATVDEFHPPVGSRAPFERPEAPFTISPKDFEALVNYRRSVRWYKDMPVPRDVLDWAIRVAVESPSACNRQPFEFRVFDDPELARKVGAIPGGTKGFSNNFPCIIVVVGKLRAFPYERDRHVPYIDASLASMSLIFALEVKGLATCCINWPDIPSKNRAMASLIGMDDDERVVMSISVGYPHPQRMVPYSQKQTLSELRTFNRMNTKYTQETALDLSQEET